MPTCQRLKLDTAAIGRHLAHDEAQQGGFARAVAAHKADLMAGVQ